MNANNTGDKYDKKIVFSHVLNDAFWSKANYGVWGLEGPAQTDQDDAEPRDRQNVKV